VVRNQVATTGLGCMVAGKAGGRCARAVLTGQLDSEGLAYALVCRRTRAQNFSNVETDVVFSITSYPPGWRNWQTQRT